MPRLLAIAAGLSLALLPAARAAELFRAAATNGVITITDSNHDFIALISDVVNNSDRFAALVGTPVASSIGYLGVGTAVRVDQDITGRSVRFRIDRIGFDRTFTGSSPRDVQRQIEKFLKREGSAIIADFRKEIGVESSAAVTDGNPASTTASAARSVFFSQGFTSARELAGRDAASARHSPAGIAVSHAAVDISVEGVTYSGGQTRLDGNLGALRLNDRLRLELPFTADYVDIEGTEIYGAGATLAAPWRAVLRTDDTPLAWRLTPLFGLQTRASFDAVAGGLSWHTGAVSTLDWHVSDRFVLSLLNQVTTHRGFPLNIEGYTLDYDINQTILKNGVRATLLATRSTALGAYLVDTRFLNSAAVDAFYTAGVSFDFALAGRLSFGAGLEADLADNYHSLVGRLHAGWKW